MCVYFVYPTFLQLDEDFNNYGLPHMHDYRIGPIRLGLGLELPLK